MYLRSLRLKNYRKFESFSIDFDNRLTLLVGDNASGKSSVLDAAAVALGAFFAGLDGVRSNGIQPGDALVKGHVLGSVVDRQSQYPVEIAATGMVREGEPIAWARSLKGNGGKTTSADAKSIISTAKQFQEEVRRGDPATVLPVVAYYGTGRLWNRKSDRRGREVLASFRRLDGYTDALDPALDDKALLDWFKKMTVQEAQKALGYATAGESPELNAVKCAMQRCLDAVVGREGSRVQYNLDTEDLDVCCLDAAGDWRVDALHTMSDGYRGVLTLVADIAYRMALLNPALLSDVLETPGVVLIDEVDLHLHPLWQARILGDLRRVFPNVQFIASTHAPIVVSSVAKEHVRFIEGEKAVAPVDQTYGRDADDILRHVMNAHGRPVRVASMFDAFYGLLDEGQFEGAERVLGELETLVGSSDSDLVAAQTALCIERL